MRVHQRKLVPSPTRRGAGVRAAQEYHNPHANKLMIHMLAAFAEHERDQIRARTKAALAAAKAKGVVLGRYGREVLSKQNRARAMDRARELGPVVNELRNQGLTVAQITGILNERGIETVRAKR